MIDKRKGLLAGSPQKTILSVGKGLISYPAIKVNTQLNKEKI